MTEEELPVPAVGQGAAPSPDASPVKPTKIARAVVGFIPRSGSDGNSCACLGNGKAVPVPVCVARDIVAEAHAADLTQGFLKIKRQM